MTSRYTYLSHRCVFAHDKCLLDGESDNTPIDETKERTFASSVRFELDGEDIEPFIELLSSLDRQMFIGIGNNYPIERFETNNKVQFFNVRNLSHYIL